jgi:hypothetical protein
MISSWKVIEMKIITSRAKATFWIWGVVVVAAVIAIALFVL